MILNGPLGKSKLKDAGKKIGKIIENCRNRIKSLKVNIKKSKSMIKDFVKKRNKNKIKSKGKKRFKKR